MNVLFSDYGVKLGQMNLLIILLSVFILGIMRYLVEFGDENGNAL